MQIKITEAQARRFLAIRTLAHYDKLHERRVLYREIRNEHGVPTSVRMRIAVENPNSPLYRVIRDKHSGLPLDDGRPEPAVEPAKKVTAKAAPAKKAAVKAAPAKKAAVKAAPAKKAAVRINKQTFSPVKTATHTVEVRATINGVRQRLGYAVSEEVKAKVIAKAKKDAGM